MEQENIVILGAGVIGLTSALLLSQNPHYCITVAATHMPGDYSISYASPWAGANYDTYAPKGSYANTLEKETWPNLQDLALNHLDAGIHFQDTRCVLRSKDRGTEKYNAFLNSKQNYPWLKHWELAEDEVRQDWDRVIVFESVCINTAIYLPWLVGRCLTSGVTFKRASVGHIRDAIDMHNSHQPADIIVNCTGLGARSLGGVVDLQMYPVRGQTVLVAEENDAMYAVSGTDGPDDDRDYQMKRAAGGGTVLGGCAQDNCWNTDIDMELAERIKSRAVDLCPALLQGKKREEFNELTVIKHGVGLRPTRETGPRIETESLGDVKVVHCYGHGGAGYQQSYGSAKEVVRLVEHLSDLTVQRDKLHKVVSP